MALSKQEQDALDEIEKGLRADSSFSVGLDPLRVRRRGRRRTVGLVVGGLLLLVIGEVLAMAVVVVGVVVAVCGFVVMLAACAPSRSWSVHRVRPGNTVAVPPGRSTR